LLYSRIQNFALVIEAAVRLVMQVNAEASYFAVSGVSEPEMRGVSLPVSGLRQLFVE
jgi:hypothetical protein